MPVVRAADIVSITTTDLDLDETTLKATRGKAEFVANSIRRLAEQTVCYTEDMESVENTDMLKLQVLSQPPEQPPQDQAQRLNDAFHKLMVCQV